MVATPHMTKVYKHGVWMASMLGIVTVIFGMYSVFGYLDPSGTNAAFPGLVGAPLDMAYTPCKLRQPKTCLISFLNPPDANHIPGNYYSYTWEYGAVSKLLRCRCFLQIERCLKRQGAARRTPGRLSRRTRNQHLFGSQYGIRRPNKSVLVRRIGLKPPF